MTADAAPAAPARTDVRSMIMAHDGFRASMAPAADLVRGVAAGDARRAQVVAEYLDLMLTVLGHHHAAEDELLWPLLRERAPGELAAVAALLQDLGLAVRDAAGEVATLLPAWRSDPAAAATSRLAAAVEHLVAVLGEQLHAEELHLLPIAASALDQGEWDAVGRRAVAGVPKALAPVVLGMLMEVGDPQVVAAELRKAPAGVRTVLRWAAPQAWQGYRRRLLGE